VVITAVSGTLTHTTTVTVNVSIHVAPVLKIPQAQTVSELTTISFKVNVTDSSDPAPSLTLSASQLPAGASFATVSGTSPISGIFTWTPDEAQAPGTYTVGFTVTDGSLSASGTVIVTVVDPPRIPTINVPEAQTVTVGKTLSFTVTANDPVLPGETMTVSASGLVSGMSFDASTGVFSFTPTTSQAGQNFTIVFTAADGDNPSASSSKSVQIRAAESSSNTPGGICISCISPTHWSGLIWLLVIGVLVGIVSSMIMLNMRARTELNAHRKRAAAARAGNDHSAREWLAQTPGSMKAKNWTKSRT